jgi:hypothetical protein
MTCCAWQGGGVLILIGSSGRQCFVLLSLSLSLSEQPGDQAAQRADILDFGHSLGSEDSSGGRDLKIWVPTGHPYFGIPNLT